VSDIKLFRVGNGAVDELQGRFVAVEKSLQILIERHLRPRRREVLRTSP
jgi:hypothetical protein